MFALYETNEYFTVVGASLAPGGSLCSASTLLVTYAMATAAAGAATDPEKPSRRKFKSIWPRKNTQEYLVSVRRGPPFVLECENRMRWRNPLSRSLNDNITRNNTHHHIYCCYYYF